MSVSREKLEEAMYDALERLQEVAPNFGSLDSLPQALEMTDEQIRECITPLIQQDFGMIAPGLLLLAMERLEAGDIKTCEHWLRVARIALKYETTEPLDEDDIH